MRISDWSSDVCSSDLNGRHKAWRERLHHQRYRPSSHGESDTIDAAGPHDLSAPYATDTRQIWGSALQFGFAFRGGSGGSRSRRRHADAATAGCLAIIGARPFEQGHRIRSEEHTSELQSLMRISYAVFCL